MYGGSCADPHDSGHWLDISGVSALRNLSNFTAQAGSYFEDFNLKEVLDNNSGTLRNLSLSTMISAKHDLDNAFFSDTIRNLTHLRLVDIYTSGSIISRIAYAQTLQSLTLHGEFGDGEMVYAFFSSCRITEGQHSLFPHLTSFRFILTKESVTSSMIYQSVMQFLKQRKMLMNLDLGDCPWNLLALLLPDLKGLRALRAKITDPIPHAVNF